MRVCRNCNKSFPADTRFCPECGDQLEEGSQITGVNGGGQGQDELIGRNFFGEYEIVDRLGEGGMGAVYLAEQEAIGQKVALKVLHTESADSDEIIQRFHREARVISMLTHPNIVRVFIFGRTQDDLLYMAMEFVEGSELRGELDGTPMDELEAIRVMKQVCSAVAEAHDLDIIHRDLKPENILLTKFRGDDKFVKILDFGIAKIKQPDDQGPQLTQAGIVYGTPEYLSPEQAQAEDLDHRTDIYALGSILFEMMTGQVPFQADASVELLKQKVFEDPPRPSEYAPVAPTMEEIIMTAMAKNRGDRFDDALQMFDALERREEEIKRNQQQSGAGQRSFPGSELTGMHRAIDADEADELEAGEWDEMAQTAAAEPPGAQQGAQGGQPAASGGSNQGASGSAGSSQFGTADTKMMQGEDSASGRSGTNPGTNPGANAGTNPRGNPSSAQSGRGGSNAGSRAARADASSTTPPGAGQQTNQPQQRAQAGRRQGTNPGQQRPQRADAATHEQKRPDEHSADEGGNSVRRYILIGLVFVASSVFLGLLIYLVLLLMQS